MIKHRETKKETDVTVKNIAQNVIRSLPQKATMDDIIHALYVRAKFQHGEDEIRHRKGITHEEAKKRLRRWVK